MFSLEGKKAVVTGGGSGIGRSIAVLLARQGAEVHILDFDEASALNVVNEIKERQGKGSAIKCDVSNQQEVADIIKDITGKNKKIISAGILCFGTFLFRPGSRFAVIFKERGN